MGITNSYIEKYMEVNGSYPKGKVKTLGKTVYNVYNLLVTKENFSTADIVKFPVESRKTISEIGKRTGIDEKFVKLFFSALYNSIKNGTNKPEELYISTSNEVKQLKIDDLKNKLGLNFLSDATRKIASVASLGAITFIIYKTTKKRRSSNGRS